MTRHRAIALGGAAALIATLGGCGKEKAEDPGAVASAIKADEKASNDQLKANDLEGVVSHYADDAYFVAPGLKPADGSTQIRKVYSNGLSDKAFKLSYASDKVEAGSGGDLAYSRGRYTEQYTDLDTGKVMRQTGSYLSVYKKQADGSWKMVEDFAAADPGKATEVPPEKPAQRARMVSF